MSEIERKETDIWVKGVKTIVSHHKKSLLDYADAVEKNSSGCDEAIGKMKARIHNDLSQIQFTVGVLFETFRSGGTIKPFEDSFKGDNNPNNIHQQKRPGNVNPNQVSKVFTTGSK